MHSLPIPTGVSHIASALKTHGIVIHTNGEPNRWSLSDSNLHYLVDWTTTPDFSVVMQGARNLMKVYPRV